MNSVCRIEIYIKSFGWKYISKVLMRLHINVSKIFHISQCNQTSTYLYCLRNLWGCNIRFRYFYERHWRRLKRFCHWSQIFRNDFYYFFTVLPKNMTRNKLWIFLRDTSIFTYHSPFFASQLYIIFILRLFRYLILCYSC